MSDSNSKPWERPWTTREIVDNASNWSLAADVGLLKYLEQLSENLLTKANATNDKLNGLVQRMTDASLSLDIARNEFLSLSNTQFMESRVYEDDETLSAEVDRHEELEDKRQIEEDRLRDMKSAVLTGLDVVDRYFDKVEVPASDSEDETDFPSFILRPKDPYIDRPLPYVIGSEEWYEKWHVGLAESSSDSETEKASEKFSDTDSESDLPVTNRQAKSASESGSEADLSGKIHNGGGPVANSTFNDTNREFGGGGSSGSEEFDSASAQASISQNNFAEQLAAKLGGVVARNDAEVTEPEVNRRPIQKASGIGDFGNLFVDKPPPLDDADDDLFGGSSSGRGVFSGGGGLFDDLEDDVGFWGEKKDAVHEQKAQGNESQSKSGVSERDGPPPNLFDDEDDAIFVGTTKNEVASLRKKDATVGEGVLKAKGLFDEDDDLLGASDDDLFNNKSRKAAIDAILAKPARPLFDPSSSTQPTESDGGKKKKVLVGGISVYGNVPAAGVEIRKVLLKNRRDSSDDEIREAKPDAPSEDALKIDGATTSLWEPGDETDDIFATSAAKKAEAKGGLEPKAFGGLFDDDLFDDDLFSGASAKTFSSGLFDDVDDFLASDVGSKARGFFEDVAISTGDEHVSGSGGARGKLTEAGEVDEDLHARKALGLFDDDFADAKLAKKTSMPGLLFSDEDYLAEDDDLFPPGEIGFDTNRTVKVEGRGKTDSDEALKGGSVVADVLRERRDADKKMPGLFDDDADDDLFAPKSAAVGGPLTGDGSSSGLDEFRKSGTNFDDKGSTVQPPLAEEVTASKSGRVESPGSEPETTQFVSNPEEGEGSSGPVVFQSEPNLMVSAEANLSDDDDSIGAEVLAKLKVAENQVENSQISKPAVFPDQTAESWQVPARGKPILPAKPSLRKAARVEGEKEEEEEVGGLFASDLASSDAGVEKFDHPPTIRVQAESKPGPAPDRSKADGISLFDPSPPPDVDNWDARSESNPFDDDVYSFDGAGGEQRSSIFDNEPPSLLYNESSGIVRDQSARNETDESSFFPYASSSRRLSTDWSHEEASGDAILVTRTLSAADAFNFLQDIAEASHSSDGSYRSAFDLTPSGKVEELYSEEVSRVVEEDGSNARLEEENDRVKDSAGRGKRDDSEVKEVKPPVDATPADGVQGEQRGEAIEDRIGGPGKLQRNLNINVRALLPGAAPPRRQFLEKSKSLDFAKERERQDEGGALEAAPSKSPPDLHGVGGSVEVLQSVTKDRVRIPAKRRPSTRKGREALRKSCIDFTALDRAAELDEDDRTKSAEDERQFLAELGARRGESFPAPAEPAPSAEAASTASVDAAGDRVLLKNQPIGGDMDGGGKRGDAGMETTAKSFLSVEGGPSGGGARRTSFVKTDNFESPDFKKSDLFDDDEDNGDDIFSAKKLPPKSDILRRSLFDDDDDDDDGGGIFATNVTSTKTSGDVRSAAAADRRPKPSALKRLENTEVIFDPLDALKK